MVMKKFPRADTPINSKERILQLWHKFFSLNSQEVAKFGDNSWSKGDNKDEALGDVSKGTRELMPL